MRFLFGLAPGGVYLALSVAVQAVRSYRTISPLPVSWRYLLCCTIRGLTSPRRYLAPMSFGARTFLQDRRSQRLSGQLDRQSLARLFQQITSNITITHSSLELPKQGISASPPL